MRDPISFQEIHNQDTMYFYQSMQQPDKDDFVKAIIKEINGHTEQKHWKLLPRREIPEGDTVITAVWEMKLTRDIKTQSEVKGKTRLNIHGGKQEYYVNYFENYPPMVK